MSQEEIKKITEIINDYKNHSNKDLEKAMILSLMNLNQQNKKLLS